MIFLLLCLILVSLQFRFTKSNSRVVQPEGAFINTNYSSKVVVKRQSNIAGLLINKLTANINDSVVKS